MARTYTTKLGDTWDIISYECYGSEMFTAELTAANWEHRNTGVFGGGVVVAVPTISTARRDANNLPPWRRGK